MHDLRTDLADIDALLTQARDGGVSSAHPLLPLLERDGLVTEASGHGHQAWQVAHGAGCVAGLDLGGTKLYGALADMSGRIVAEASEPTRHDGEEATLEQLATMVRSLQEKADAHIGGLRAIGLGVPGFVSAETGSIALSPNLSLSSDFDFDGRLSALFGGCPVRMDNDVNFAVLGEYWRGQGRDLFFAGRQRGADCGSLAFLSLGTGIGLGLMIDGRVVRGASGGAGEIAYMPAGIDPFASARTTFGGSYEDIVGSPGIRRRYGEEGVTVREIFDRAAAGERKAASVIDDTARQIAVGAATIATLIDPEMIVLGGGIGTRADFAELIIEYTAELTPVAPRIGISRLGQRAGVVGAIMETLLEIRQAMLRTGEPRKGGSGSAPGGLADPGEAPSAHSGGGAHAAAG
ncbi:ROK family protein [Martelella endophytica]|uniref:ROK family protein n=1 Tax=Martelella endophytica TaxID=1486262 RepID=UPI0006969CC1|nr:ROK family protein [Martelella endophytica]